MRRHGHAPRRSPAEGPALADQQAALGEFPGAVTSISSMSLAGVDILLVDDEEDTLALFQESLEAAGATVRAVTSAAEALREHRELLRAIRATHPYIPAVAVTAYARLGDRVRSRAAGFQAHVAKPIDPTAFVRTLIAAVSNTP